MYIWKTTVFETSTFVSLSALSLVERPTKAMSKSLHLSLSLSLVLLPALSLSGSISRVSSGANFYFQYNVVSADIIDISLSINVSG